MNRIGAILFILTVVYFIFLIRQDIIDNLDLRREGERVSSAISREEKLSGELKERLCQLQSDKFIEGLARTRLGLIKKGETAYKVVGR